MSDQPPAFQAVLRGGRRDGEVIVVRPVGPQFASAITYGKPAEEIGAKLEVLARTAHMSRGTYRLIGEVEHGRLAHQWREHDGAQHDPVSGRASGGQ